MRRRTLGDTTKWRMFRTGFRAVTAARGRSPARLKAIPLTLATMLVLGLSAPGAFADPPSFTLTDGDGITTQDLDAWRGGDGHDNPNAIITQSDGKILVTGYAESSTPGVNEAFLQRYHRDGTLDTSFGGGDGTVTLDVGVGVSDFGERIVVQPDGKILMTGWTLGGEWFAARYDTAGNLDAGFGTGGVTTVDPNGATIDFAYGIDLQSDGKIILSGYSGSQDNTLVRLNTDGSLDAGFGVGGIVITDNFPSEKGWNVVVLDNDKILLGGSANDDFQVSRYNADGTVDTSFGGGDGHVEVNIGSFGPVGYIAVQDDGKIVQD